MQNPSFSRIPTDMFSRQICVGDILAKAVNIPKVQLVLMRVTRVNGCYVFLNNSPSPIRSLQKYIVITPLVPKAKMGSLLE